MVHLVSRAHTAIILVSIAKQVRDTEGDPRGWRALVIPASVLEAWRAPVFEALGYELGELLHPRGKHTRDDAPRHDLVLAAATHHRRGGSSYGGGSTAEYEGIAVATPRVPQDAIRSLANAAHPSDGRQKRVNLAGWVWWSFGVYGIQPSSGGYTSARIRGRLYVCTRSVPLASEACVQNKSWRTAPILR
ncbi:hypothetical protein KM043_010320 [Ampulex compressa]|nr:hypothetical protein KM043_010320 [Ampulex compressa]